MAWALSATSGGAAVIDDDVGFVNPTYNYAEKMVRRAAPYKSQDVGHVCPTYKNYAGLGCW